MSGGTERREAWRASRRGVPRCHGPGWTLEVRRLRRLLVRLRPLFVPREVDDAESVRRFRNKVFQKNLICFLRGSAGRSFVVANGAFHMTIVLHAGCSLADALNWWTTFQGHGSPWEDNAIHNRHTDAARFNATLLRVLGGLVRTQSGLFLRELSSIFKRLAFLSDWDTRWPPSVSSLGEILCLIGFSVKNMERLESERSLALVVAHCRLARQIPDRHIVVADETHSHGAEIIRPRGRSSVGQPLEVLAPNPRPRQCFSSIQAITHNTGVLELTDNEVAPAQSGDD